MNVSNRRSVVIGTLLIAVFGLLFSSAALAQTGTWGLEVWEQNDGGPYDQNAPFCETGTPCTQPEGLTVCLDDDLTNCAVTPASGRVTFTGITADTTHTICLQDATYVVVSGSAGGPSIDSRCVERTVPEGDSTTAMYVELAEADIEVTVVENSDDPVIAGSGADNLAFTFTAANNGPGDATNVVFVATVNWTLDFQGFFCDATPGYSAEQVGPLTVELTFLPVNLAASATQDFVVTCTVDATATHNNVFSTTVAVDSLDQVDPDDTNDSATEDATIIRQSTFDVTKTWAAEGAGEVDVTLTCNDVVVDSATTSGGSAELTVTDFADATVCVVEETVPAGFSPTYSEGCSADPVASGQAYECGIVNAQSQARFAVYKTYSDGNDDDVQVTLTCNNGLPLEQSFSISEGNPVFFVITNFTHGEADCEVTETGTAEGYTPSFDNGTVVSDVSCAYDDIVSDDYVCTISNAAEPAEFTVYKEWVIEGAVGDEVIEEAHVTIRCESEIAGGYYTGYEYVYNTTLYGDGDSVTVSVDTTLGPAVCWASEEIYQSGVEQDNDCGTRQIPAGGSSSCTFTNTVFFEGIPTLSQYGMALMALLMLGLGFVGLRRFV